MGQRDRSGRERIQVWERERETRERDRSERKEERQGWERERKDKKRFRVGERKIGREIGVVEREKR